VSTTLSDTSRRSPNVTPPGGARRAALPSRGHRGPKRYCSMGIKASRQPSERLGRRSFWATMSPRCPSPNYTPSSFTSWRISAGVTSWPTCSHPWRCCSTGRILYCITVY